MENISEWYRTAAIYGKWPKGNDLVIFLLVLRPITRETVVANNLFQPKPTPLRTQRAQYHWSLNNGT